MDDKNQHRALAAKKNGNGTTAVANKDNNGQAKAAAAGGGKKATEDPYEKLGSMRTAFSTLTLSAKQRAEENRFVKVDAVPVGERRSDQRKARHRSDGSKAERVAMHPTPEGSAASSSSSDVSDDSYEDAFVDETMGKRSQELARAAPSPAQASKKIDFEAMPFHTGLGDSALAAAAALEWLLSPCVNQTFFTDFFQSTVLVARRNDAGYYGNLFSSPQMMRVLRDHHLDFGVNVNLARYADGVRTTHNGVGRAYPLIANAVRDGCSVELTNVQAFSDTIWYICEVLQEVFHCFVGANTYLTPAGSAGFAQHWDEIDSFLLQVEGRKYWKVYAPARSDDEPPFESSGNFTDAEMAGREPAFEGWIEQGDLLYIPRGFIHQARTDPDVHSLHVTVSAGRQWTYANLLQKTLNVHTLTIPKLRKQLPPGLLDMASMVEACEYPQKEAAVRLVEVLDRSMSHFRAFGADLINCGVDMQAREFMRTALPPLLSHEEKQLSVWGNEEADLFLEKGASRIGEKSEVRFIRRHGQRLLIDYETAEERWFVVHRMANARSYEGRAEQLFDVDIKERNAFIELHNEYPEWTKVAELQQPKKAKAAFLQKLFDNGLIMVRTP